MEPHSTPQLADRPPATPGRRRGPLLGAGIFVLVIAAAITAIFAVPASTPPLAPGQAPAGLRSTLALLRGIPQHDPRPGQRARPGRGVPRPPVPVLPPRGHRRAAHADHALRAHREGADAAAGAAGAGSGLPAAGAAVDRALREAKRRGVKSVPAVFVGPAGGAEKRISASRGSVGAYRDAITRAIRTTG